MCHKKKKTNINIRAKKKKTDINIRAKPGTDPLPPSQSAGSRTLFYLRRIMPQISTEDSGILK